MQATGPMLTADDLRRLAAPGEEIECYFSERHSLSAEVRHGRLETVRSGTEVYAEVRLRKDGRLHRAGGRTNDAKSLIDAARMAPGTPSEATFASPEDGPMSQASQATEGPGAASVTAQAAMLRDALRASVPGLLPQVTAGVHRVERRITNSLGLQERFLTTTAQLAGGGREVLDGDFHTVNRSALSSDELPEVGPLAAQVARRYAFGRRIVRIESGRYPVVIGPGIMLSLLAPVLARLSAPALLAGTSPWLGREGEEALSPLFTLESDPTLPDGPRRGPRDDEGTRTSRAALVAAGRIAGLILDREAAVRLSRPAWGTAYCGEFGQAPTPRPGNLAVAEGTADLSDLLRSAPRLLLLEGWIGGRPTNPLRGEIAGNAVGLYLVEGGEVMGRVKNAVVSLNAFDALGNGLQALSRQREWVAGGMLQTAPGLLPHALLEGASVAVRAQ